MRSVLLAFLVATTPLAAQSSTHRLQVDAGPYDRYQAVTMFEASPGLTPGSYMLKKEGRPEIPLQVDDAGLGWFILDQLAAGGQVLFDIQSTDSQEPPAVSARREGRLVRLAAGGNEIAVYHVEPGPLPRPDIDPIYLRAGYLHPVNTPGGQIVTDDYPPNHIHHHGIWAAWTLTRFQGRTPDFWNMGGGTGTVLADGLEADWSGPVQAGLTALHRYVDLSAQEPIDVLKERWTTRVYHPVTLDRPVHILDVELEQWTLTDSALVLSEYRYGGIGFRGRREWDGEENTVFLTSEGRTRADGHATRSRWVHIGGAAGSGMVGAAVLSHPDNFQAPEPMRIHPSEPFFNYAPSQAGDWAIRPGERHRARYRFLLYDGEPDLAVLERAWRDYADPPKARLLP